MWRSWDQEKVDQTCAREAIEAGDTGYIYKYGNNEARNENEGISEHSNNLDSAPHYNITNETSGRKV